MRLSWPIRCFGSHYKHIKTHTLITRAHKLTFSHLQPGQLFLAHFTSKPILTGDVCQLASIGSQQSNTSVLKKKTHPIYDDRTLFMMMIYTGCVCEGHLTPEWASDYNRQNMENQLKHGDGGGGGGGG